MKIEKKITYIVAGIEFQNLKTAQFFQRALTLHLQDLDLIGEIDEEHEARMMLNLWKCHMHAEYTDLDVIEVVMSTQLPKPARKKKKNILNHETHEDALLFSPGFKDMDPAPAFLYEAIDAFDTTFAKVSTLGEQEETKFEMIPDDDVYSANTRIFDVNGVRLN